MIIVGFCINVQNIPKVGQYAVELWPYMTFYNMAYIRHLGF